MIGARPNNERSMADMTTPKPPLVPAAVSVAEQSLIEYPSNFPIKVMGLNVDGYVNAMTRIAENFDPHFDASTIELRPSKGDKYLGVTLHITAPAASSSTSSTAR